MSTEMAENAEDDAVHLFTIIILNLSKKKKKKTKVFRFYIHYIAQVSPIHLYM